MGARGPAKKKNHLKILKGEKNKDRLKGKTPDMPKLAKCPKSPKGELKKEGRKAWKKYAPLCFQAGLLTEADILAFTYLCKLHETLEGMTPKDKGYSTLFKDFKSLLEQFGLTPGARSRMNIEPPKAPMGGAGSFIQ